MNVARKSAAWSILMLGLIAHLKAQANFLDGQNAYLGQKPPSEIPEVFAPGLLADPGTFAIGRIGLSPDGTEIYYTQNDTWFDNKHEQIKYFLFQNGSWKGPNVLFYRVANPALSVDGKTLYLGGSMTQVKRSFRRANGWSPPEAFLESASIEVYNFNPTAGGNFYACSNPTKEDIRNGSTDVFSLVALTNGVPVAKSLGRPLNGIGFNGDFFVSPDESFIVLSAKESKDFECEIDISFRKSDGTWTNPKSLGPDINDGVAHRFGEFVTPDNRYLFYTRGTSPKDTKILWVRFDKMLARLRHTNFDPYVKSRIGDQAATVGKPFVGKVPDDAFVDDDGKATLSFTASLSDGSQLPSWLNFNPSTLTFFGIPGRPDTFKVVVTATDTSSASASCGFAIAVRPGN